MPTLKHPTAPHSFISTSQHTDRSIPVKNNGRLDGVLVAHRLQTLLPLFKLVQLIHYSGHLDLARVKVVNGCGELVDLGEAADDLNFVAN